MGDANGQPGKRRGGRRKRRRPPPSVRHQSKWTPDEIARHKANTGTDGEPDADPNLPTETPLVGFGADTPLKRADMAMVRQAARHRWAIDERLYDVLPSQIAEIAVTPDQPAKIVLAATKTLLTMNSQNQRDDHHATPNAGVNIQGSNVQIVLPDNGRGDAQYGE